MAPATRRGTLKTRLGRQQFGFDLQRFVSVRDGPNVRQSYDAAWFDYEHGLWRYITFYSHPVQNRDLRPFDDVSNNHLTYGGFRIERKVLESAALPRITLVSRKTEPAFPSTAAMSDAISSTCGLLGPSRIRLGHRRDESDGMFGGGTHRGVGVWVDHRRYTALVAVATRVGCKSMPRPAIDRTDRELNTFNPLFPNGYYVTLAGYTGFVNFIHLKPSLTLHPITGSKSWAPSACSGVKPPPMAVYTQPDVPVAGTVGHGDGIPESMDSYALTMRPRCTSRWHWRSCISRLAPPFDRWAA